MVETATAILMYLTNWMLVSLKIFIVDSPEI